jgi:GGDEF domain-containing protein
MREAQILESLEDIAKKVSIRIRRENFRGNGGLCRVRGESFIIINRYCTPGEQIQVLARSLAGVDLDGVYIAPRVREEIDRWQGVQEPDDQLRAG